MNYQLLKLENPWVYHNTDAVDEIRSKGLDAGSFSSAPIDFGKRYWLAVRLCDLPGFGSGDGFEEGPSDRNCHTYGGVTAYEPRWEFVDEEDVRRRHVVPVDKIVFLSGQRRVATTKSRGAR